MTDRAPPPDPAALAVARDFEAAFTAIAETRMRGLPVMNPALSVAARGFRRLGAHRIGVLATPWFMNAIALPDPPDGEKRRVGAKATLTLPSGGYEFVWGIEEGIGGFWSCSLFSPMFEFKDWDAARAAAEAALVALTTPEDAPPPASAGLNRRELFRGRSGTGAAT